MKHYIYLLIVVAATMLTSCKAKKGIATIDNKDIQTEQALYASVVNNNFKFEAIQSKVKLGLGKTTLNGKFCLESGKHFGVIINAPIIGFELGRVEATKDQILLIDKFDKVYSNITLADMNMPKALVGHEAEALECLFLARIYLPGKGTATMKDFSAFDWSMDSLTVATYKDPDYKLTYTFGNNGMLVSTKLMSTDNKLVEWKYSNYIEVESGKLFPMTHDIEISDENGDKSTFHAHINNPTLGESTWKEIKNITSYREVTITELGETLKKHAK